MSDLGSHEARSTSSGENARHTNAAGGRVTNAADAQELAPWVLPTPAPTDRPLPRDPLAYNNLVHGVTTPPPSRNSSYEDLASLGGSVAPVTHTDAAASPISAATAELLTPSRRSMRAARSRTTQGLSDGGSNRREPGASAASQGQGSGAANAQAPLRSQSTPASSTDSAPKPKPARYNSAPTAVASEAANASSQPPPAESTRPAVRRQQGLFWQPRMQYQFGARNLRTIGKARKRASTADVGKVSDNGAMAMAKAKPGAISSPALLASFRPRTESASHAVGHSGSSSLSLGNPNQAANHNATKADDLTSDSVEEDADSGPSLFENSDSATAMRTVGATASASSSSSSSSNNNNEGASGNVAQWPHHQRAAKHRSLSEPYFNSRKVPPRGAGVGPYGGGRNGRTRGPRPRSRTVRATSESSADSSLTSGTGGGGGAAKSYSRYRALSFLEDINEPDAQGFTVLLRAVQAKNLERVQQCLDSGADVNRANADGFTPLLLATVKNAKDIVELLLQHDQTDAHITTKRGCSALFLAAHDGLCDIMHVLLRYGADRDKADRWGETPADAATAQGHLHVVEYLRITRGFTPLHYAVLMRDNDAIVELLRAGADPLAFPDTAEGAAATEATSDETLTASQSRNEAATAHDGVSASSPSRRSRAIRRLSPRRRQALLRCPELRVLTPLDVSKVACDTFGQFEHKAFPPLDHTTIRLLSDACQPWSVRNHYLFPDEERAAVRFSLLVLHRNMTEKHLAWKILGLTSRGYFASGAKRKISNGDYGAFETKNEQIDAHGNAKTVDFESRSFV